MLSLFTISPPNGEVGIETAKFDEAAGYPMAPIGRGMPSALPTGSYDERERGGRICVSHMTDTVINCYTVTRKLNDNISSIMEGLGKQAVTKTIYIECWGHV